MRHVDILVDDDFDRDVLAAAKLVGAGAQNGAQRCIEPSQRPALRQRAVDLAVELALLAHDAAHDVVEMCRVGLGNFLVLGRPLKQVLREFLNGVIKRRARNVHLVERLHGAETRCAARSRIDALV